MTRGDIFMADINPVEGPEANKVRPVMHVVVRPSPANGLRIASKAQTEQVRSLDLSRLGRQVGQLGRRDLAAVDAALRHHLAL